MNIEEIRQQKQQLETLLTEALKNFEQSTGTQIEDIRLSRITSQSASELTQVSLTLQIP